MIQLLRRGRLDDPLREGAYWHAGRRSRRDAAALFAAFRAKDRWIETGGRSNIPSHLF